MKTVSNLGQNFRACLPAIAGREAFTVLEKPGGLPSKRVGEDSRGTWLPADTKRGCQELTLGGGVGHRERHIPQLKLLVFFAGQPWPVMPCSLRGWQPASQTQARWVSRLCVEREPVVDRVKKPVYFLGKVSGWLC